MGQDIRKMLGINIVSPYWEQAYRQALADPCQPEWLTEEYIRGLHRNLHCLSENLELVVQGLNQVNRNETLCLFVKTLLHILELHKPFGECFSEFAMPVAPANGENTLAYDILGIFPLLAHVPVVQKELEQRGIDAGVISRYFSEFDNGISECTEEAGRPFYSRYYFSAHWGFVFYQSLVIERLRFEMAKQTRYPVRIFRSHAGETAILMDGVTIHASGHILGAAGCTDPSGAYEADYRETPEFFEGYPTDARTGLVQPKRIRLLKAQWSPVYAFGDGIMKVHIPFKGQFNEDICNRSYEKARQLFSRCFPEYTSAGFISSTWLLAPELEPILKPDSGIRGFRNPYHKFPLASKGIDIFEYVFKINVQDPAQVNLDSLPENTSLQRNVKALCKQGVIFHNFGGFIPW